MYLRFYMFESRKLNDVGDVIVDRAAHWLALPGVTSHGSRLPSASARGSSVRPAAPATTSRYCVVLYSVFA